MSDERPPLTPAIDSPEEEAELRELLVEAGPRPEAPAGDLAAIRAAAREEWARRYPPAARRRPGAAWWAGLAAAALLAAALGLAWWTRRAAPPAGPVLLATVARVSGSATWRSAEGRTLPLRGGDAGGALGAGALVETAGASGAALPSRVALRLLDGASLRLDAGSRVRLVAPHEVELLAGALYVDSSGGPAAGRPGLAVRTPAGVFREVGTQFEVRLLRSGEGAVRLRVREGRVALGRGARGTPLVGAAGEELLVAGGAVGRRRFAPDDPDWGWVLAAAPPFAAEGATVREFLDWLAREAGWRLELAGPEAAAVAEATVIHGSIAHLRPTEALGPVLRSAGLAHRLEGGRLVVSAPSPAAR